MRLAEVPTWSALRQQRSIISLVPIPRSFYSGDQRCNVNETYGPAVLSFCPIPHMSPGKHSFKSGNLSVNFDERSRHSKMPYDPEKTHQEMERYRICFRPPSDERPPAYQKTFEDIEGLGRKDYNSYCAEISIRPDETPWKQQAKARAEWLAKRSARLFGQQQNEAGWRFGLENEVLRQFSVEVAGRLELVDHLKLSRLD